MRHVLGTRRPPRRTPDPTKTAPEGPRLLDFNRGKGIRTDPEGGRPPGVLPVSLRLRPKTSSCGVATHSFGDRQRCILRLGTSWNLSTRGRILRNYSKNLPAARAAARGDSCNNLKESGPEWRNSKKPLTEEYAFAYPRNTLGFSIHGFGAIVIVKCLEILLSP